MHNCLLTWTPIPFLTTTFAQVCTSQNGIETLEVINSFSLAGNLKPSWFLNLPQDRRCAPLTWKSSLLLAKDLVCHCQNVLHLQKPGNRPYLWNMEASHPCHFFSMTRRAPFRNLALPIKVVSRLIPRLPWIMEKQVIQQRILRVLRRETKSQRKVWEWSLCLVFTCHFPRLHRLGVSA